jgi:molybdopterin converting factor small subunit
MDKLQHRRKLRPYKAKHSAVRLGSSTAATTSDSPVLIGSLPNYTIRIAYFGFLTVQTTGTEEEYLTLPAPVFLQDVLSKIGEEHVVLAAMLPTMAIMVNGITADGNPQLSNNSEVDIVPTFAGG